MLAPHELKNKDFTKSLRGYSTVEVDEHIAFLIEKYTELYRLNDDLEKKLRLTEAQLDAIKGEEESIRTTLVNAQKASTRIINEANERADVIMRSAKNSCDRLIAEMKASVKLENEKLIAAKNEVAAFKAALFEEYRTHIEQIEKIAPEIDAQPVTDESLDELSDSVLSRIRSDLSGRKPLISGTEDPFTPETEEESAETEPTAKAAESAATEDEDILAADPIPAEQIIPDRIDDDNAGIVPDQAAFTAARDSEETFFAEDDLDIRRQPASSETAPENGSSLGLIDSIRRLNESVGDDGDDEEFLQMLKNVSTENDRTEMTSTDEFEMVYDGRKK